jgi:hypothetical protein
LACKGCEVHKFLKLILCSRQLKGIDPLLVKGSCKITTALARTSTLQLGNAECNHQIIDVLFYITGIQW